MQGGLERGGLFEFAEEDAKGGGFGDERGMERRGIGDLGNGGAA